MTISELIEVLQRARQVHGELTVTFDAYTLNFDPEDEDFQFDEESCIYDVAVLGVYEVRYEDNDSRVKVFVLGNPNGDSSLADDPELLGLRGDNGRPN